MSFCIECGAKAPEVAKFCPQCGVALVEIETIPDPAPAPVVITSDVETSEVETSDTETAEVEATEPEVETQAALEADRPEPEPEEIESSETVPSVEESLAASADADVEAPKSKTALFVGLGLAALAIAVGGANAMGLFGSDQTGTSRAASAPEIAAPAPPPVTDVVDTETDDADPVLTAYQNAILRGRISDLGQFAKKHPENSLAKDAETAAFASLQRQNTVLAYKAFTQFFPDADTSEYAGPRVNDDIMVDETTLLSEPLTVDLNEPLTTAPTIRNAITQRGAELEPFIAQGDADYVLSVIDELAVMPGLTDAEAVYLLDLSERAEAARKIDVPAEVEVTQPEAVIVETAADAPAEVPDMEAEVAFETEAECPEVETETAAPLPAYDTAAKPVERFGAEVPEAATEPGECDMFFDVTASGTPSNIDASCSDPIFVTPAKDAVSDWRYEPALLKGVPVQQNDVQVKIRFNLE